jgi:hypothetical protein
MKSLAIAFAALFVIASLVPDALAQGKKTGFGSETETSSGQGNTSNTNNNANPDNQGQTTTTTTTEGPKGQLKQGNTDCNNCETETTVDLPGKNR